jgi:hypothetical protein
MKFALGALAACGLAVAVAAPASAQVVAPGYPSCYDAYGNYVYAYPYCAAPVYPYVGFGWGGYWGPGYGGGHYGRGFGGFRGGYGGGFAGGRVGGGFAGGRMGGGHAGFAGGRGGSSGGHGGGGHGHR